MNRLTPFCLIFAALSVLQGCTTIVTHYHRDSYVKLADSNDPALLPAPEHPVYKQVDNLNAEAPLLYGQGYGLLGYSQFVSPLAQSLSGTYGTLWGKEVGAALVVQQTPQGAGGLNSRYLVTYWGKYDPDFFSLGAQLAQLPDDVLRQVGEKFNIVYIRAVVPGTPASTAGLQAGDALLSFNGKPIANVKDLTKKIEEHYGQHVVLGVARRPRGAMVIAVDLRTPTPKRKGDSTIVMRLHPWDRTSATDWSELGDIGRIVSNSIQNYQRMEQQRREEALQAQLQRQRRLDYLKAKEAEQSDSAQRRSPPDLRSALQAQPGVQQADRDALMGKMYQYMNQYDRETTQEKMDVWQNLPMINATPLEPPPPQ